MKVYNKPQMISVLLEPADIIQSSIKTDGDQGQIGGVSGAQPGTGDFDASGNRKSPIWD